MYAGQSGTGTNTTARNLLKSAAAVLFRMEAFRGPTAGRSPKGRVGQMNPLNQWT